MLCATSSSGLSIPTGKPLGAKDERSDGGKGPRVHIGHGRRTGRRKNFTQLGDGMMNGPVYLGATGQWVFLAR